MKPIALSGFMGAGKSTLGARLARSRGVPFVDLDAELEAAFGCSIPEVFARDGEAAFRAMESRLLAQALSLPDRVVALGGGAVLASENRESLRNQARWVHLDVSWGELVRRVRLQGATGKRPNWGSEEEAERRFAERAPHYAEAPMQVLAEGREGVVLDRIEAALAGAGAEGAGALESLAASSLTVPLRPPYEVVIGRGLSDRVGAAIAQVGVGPAAIVSDWNVAPLHLDALAQAVRAAGREVLTVTLPAGEGNKRLQPVSDTVERLLDEGWQRQAPVVALGGGVLGDMAGLVAALTLRGVPWVQVPTTLLAMVDSSVGGKVGVNHRRRKNLIGQFHQPSLVWTDLAYLDTLADRELRAGLAEVLKTAVLGDEELLLRLERAPERYLAREPRVLAEAIRRCVRFKASVVAEDEREAGRRAILNLGHTLGHAIEAAAAPGRFVHGEAVSIGLVAAAELSVAEGLADPAFPARIRAAARGLGLPVAASSLSRSRLLDALRGDKKLKDGAATWILMATIGDPRLRPSPLTALDARLDLLVQAGVLTETGD